MLAQALIVEADAFVAQWKDLKFPDGRDRVVRHGHGPQRAIQTGIGPVEVSRVKFRYCGAPGAADGSASPRRSCRGGRAGPRASCALAGSPLARHLDRRLPAGACRLGQARTRPNLSPAVISTAHGGW